MRIGVDLGGTKIEVLALDDGGVEIERRRVATPREDYAATVRAIAGAVERLEHDLGVSASVGVGIPGALSPATGLVKNANSTWLIGRALDRDLCAALDREVLIANDANCFAVSEATVGAAAGLGVVFGVIIGTGVGGGIAIDGRVLTGRHAIAGEWGHTALPWPRDDERPGPECYCGLRGCVETFLSGPAVEREYAACAGRTARAADLAGAAAGGDAVAAQVLDRYVDRLARGLASVVNVLDPDAIVLGGGVSNLDLIYDRVHEATARWVFSDTFETPILRNVHGDSSGVRGAAWLWPASPRPGR